MEEKVLKKENKFIDNVAYKSKFQFLIWVNDNVICQRYFKINGFNEDSVYTMEFTDCMDDIVKSIQEDLESKSRILMWYINSKKPLKLAGFATDKEIEQYGGKSFLSLLTDVDKRGDIETPDGRLFHKEYLDITETEQNDYWEDERPSEGEYVFKFSFLIDDKTVFEKIWDGNVYPKFVRNGVDLTNAYSSYNKDDSNMNFGNALVRHMQSGKMNLISDFIRRICDTLSNTFTEKYSYTKNMGVFKNNNTHSEKNDEAVAYYGGVIKPVVTGHIDLEAKNRNYNYLPAFENYKLSWKKEVSKKTQEYYATLLPSVRQVEYIEKHY